MGVSNLSLKNKTIDIITGGAISVGQRISTIRALEDISFEFSEGDRIGLVGHNGSGKSTLLKAMAGIYTPTQGKLSVLGRVVSTLNITLGFDMEATGFENIIIRGLLMGMRRKEIEQKIDDIISFTNLENYIHLPVRTYSSGMMSRLAFTIVTSAPTDILLMDEILGTGDAGFLEKANQRLTQFIDQSRIFVLASHSDEVINNFCNKAILLEKGKLIDFGSTDDILRTYHKRVEKMSDHG